MNKFRGIAAALSTALAVSSLTAFDLPVRYKTGPLNATPSKNADNWTSNISLRYGQSSTREGYDHEAQKTSALGIYGPTNLVRLGFGLPLFGQNLPNPANIGTNANWARGFAQEDLSAIPAGVPVVIPPAGRLDVPQQNNVLFTGRVATHEFALDLEQTLFSGFFASCHVPFRQITIDNIGYQIHGSQNMHGGAGTVDNFVSRDLPIIMREWGMEAWATAYRRQAVPELVAGMGWQGSNDKGFGVIDEAIGRIFVGAIIPGAGGKQSSYMTGIPLGYDNFFGVHTRVELEVGLRKILALGAATSANIFFTDTRTVRVTTDYAKKPGNGLLSLGETRATIDQGPVWDISGYAKIHKIFYGLVGQIGYSYTRQEATQLTNKDPDYMKTILTAYSQMNPPQFFNVNDVLNSDERIKPWERQVFHFSIGYDFKLHQNPPIVAPALSFNFAYPISGRRIMTGRYLGGTASLQIKMPF